MGKVPRTTRGSNFPPAMVVECSPGNASKVPLGCRSDGGYAVVGETVQGRIRATGCTGAGSVLGRDECYGGFPGCWEAHWLRRKLPLAPGLSHHFDGSSAHIHTRWCANRLLVLFPLRWCFNSEVISSSSPPTLFGSFVRNRPTLFK